MGQADMKSVADIVALDQERQKRAEPADSSLSTAGGMLRAAREAMSLDIAAVAEGTNIKPEHLEAIEAMDITALPSQPYTMGFVRAYAREVALPEDALMERFRVQAGWVVQDRATGIATGPGGKAPREGRELSVLLLFAVIGFALWCAWRLLISNAPVPEGDASRFTYTGADLDDVPVVERPVAVDAPVVPALDAGAEVSAESLVAELAQLNAPAAIEEAESAEAAAETSEVAAPVVAPAEPEAAAEVVRPRLLTRVEPVYPPQCEGDAAPVETVLVSYTINARGRVSATNVGQSTNACFNGAATAALARWRYDASTIPAGGASNQTTRFVFERPY
ncbi:MAG: helix-turn-helix domain-containing protein [Pseudomonadota bacterium]